MEYSRDFILRIEASPSVNWLVTLNPEMIKAYSYSLSEFNFLFQEARGNLNLPSK